jgi:DNA-directed RNA polymerase subunit RPC12/RpoP
MALRQKEPVVMCPRCRVRMTRRARPPLKLKLSDGLVDVSYICERCGTETKRSIREKGK